MTSTREQLAGYCLGIWGSHLDFQSLSFPICIIGIRVIIFLWPIQFSVTINQYQSFSKETGFWELIVLKAEEQDQQPPREKGEAQAGEWALSIGPQLAVLPQWEFTRTQVLVEKTILKPYNSYIHCLVHMD